MRAELYEAYKNEHPEELIEVNRVFAYDDAIRAMRARARAEKVAKVNEWKEILDGDSGTGRGE